MNGLRQNGTTLPWFIQHSYVAPIALSAIWQDWCDHKGVVGATLAMVTIKANDAMSKIHCRIPVFP